MRAIFSSMKINFLIQKFKFLHKEVEIDGVMENYSGITQAFMVNIDMT